MPSLGADMEYGTIVEWLVGPGSEVSRGDVVAVVETEKSDLDVEVFSDGTVRELLVPEGVRVPVGTPIAMIEPRRTRRGPAVQPVQSAQPPVQRAAVTVPEQRPPELHPPELHSPELHSPVLRHLAGRLRVDVAAVSGTGPGGVVTRDDIERAAQRRRPVTPRARRLAAERGLDLASIDTAASGVITGADVERATAEVPPPVAPVPAGAAPDPMRAAIARQMERAWREIPHFQVADTVDVSGAMAALAAVNASRGVHTRVLAGAVFVRAAARAAVAVPAVNGWWRDGGGVEAPDVHLGIVVALRAAGLVAPVIHDAASKDLDTIMAELRDLVTRARSGRLKASEMTGATFTLTQLGDDEADTVVPIIHPPQRAILGLGAVRRRPWVDGDEVVVRDVMRANLSADHRAVDGRSGSAFLRAFGRVLREDPV